MPKQYSKTYDYLIIGQGLAGSLLAHRLIKLGQNVLLLDNAHHNSASQVAAGLINPLTGHRLNLTDGFEEFFDVADRTYQNLNTAYKTTIYRRLKQTRLIKNAGQFEFYEKRKQQSEYQAYLSDALEHNLLESGFGFTGVQQSAIVNTKELLLQSKSWLIAHQAYEQKQVNYDQLKSNDNGVQLNEIQAKRVIFCEGYQAIHNPWLSDLPFKLSKGDVLTIQTNMPANSLLSWGNWLASNSDGTNAKLGSSYVWNDLTHIESEDSKKALFESLQKHTSLNAAVIKHEVGIRPTTLQRKPFIGALNPSTKLRNAYCFNGFGSKGCLLIPYYAELFVEHLINETALPQELTKWL